MKHLRIRKRLLSRFSAVTVLNGRIHQAIHHTEGNIQYSTAVSIAYPLPSPGDGDRPVLVTAVSDLVCHKKSVAGAQPPAWVLNILSVLSLMAICCKLPKDKLLAALGYRTVEMLPGQNTKLS